MTGGMLLLVFVLSNTGSETMLLRKKPSSAALAKAERRVSSKSFREYGDEDEYLIRAQNIPVSWQSGRDVFSAISISSRIALRTILASSFSSL